MNFWLRDASNVDYPDGGERFFIEPLDNQSRVGILVVRPRQSDGRLSGHRHFLIGEHHDVGRCPAGVHGFGVVATEAVEDFMPQAKKLSLFLEVEGRDKNKDGCAPRVSPSVEESLRAPAKGKHAVWSLDASFGPLEVALSVDMSAAASLAVYDGPLATLSRALLVALSCRSQIVVPSG